MKPTQDIDAILRQAQSGFEQYRLLPVSERLAFLHAVADGLEAGCATLAQIADSETSLGIPRLRGELTRTCHQLRSYADAVRSGYAIEAKINHADPNRTPPKPDLRKMNVPIGPVVVFGASNFPLAYSTAGGDTASALAAGCSVVVKAHPAHPQTCDAVAAIILKAACDTGMPAGVFAQVHGADHATGAALVQHPYTQAVGFTGSFSGGKALFDLAQSRPVPIPVFAEMGSVNPVYLFPEKLQAEPENIGKMLAASITLGMGQFCTNPGIMVGIESEALGRFVEVLSEFIASVSSAPMLHAGIATSYRSHLDRALQQPGVKLQGQSGTPSDDLQAIPSILSVSALDFINNPVLHQEVFGPFSLLVLCSDFEQMKQVAKILKGQLTSSVMAFPDECGAHSSLLQTIQDGCGRLVFNGVPTGVEVTLAQHHGGPFPATTDSRFTAVGADAIRRFMRPVAFQNCPAALLPPELQDENPLHIPRWVDDNFV
jgi:NADP-dependent aldehyde dehydrogenase